MNNRRPAEIMISNSASLCWLNVLCWLSQIFGWNPHLKCQLRCFCPPQVSSTATLEGKGQLKFTSGKWSPHHNCSQLATANDTAIRGWDLRTMRWALLPRDTHTYSSTMRYFCEPVNVDTLIVHYLRKGQIVLLLCFMKNSPPVSLYW